jgi:hypothetical protein
VGLLTHQKKPVASLLKSLGKNRAGGCSGDIEWVKPKSLMDVIASQYKTGR